jgi:integrase
MTMDHSTRGPKSSNSRPTPAKPTPAKPKKPNKNFPLFAHANGQWCKKVKGRLHYFGPWDDHNAALDRWLLKKDDLIAGRKPKSRAKSEQNTLDQSVQSYLAFIDQKVQRGERSERWLEDLKMSMKLFLDVVGRHWALDSLDADDFAAVAKRAWEVRTKVGKKIVTRRASPLTSQKHIHRIRGFFNWCKKQGFISDVPTYGAGFDPPDKAVINRHRNSKDQRYFSRSEVRGLLRESKSDPRMYAAILLAINTGCQNEDIATLQVKHLDLRGGWYVQPRSKKGTKRRAKIWSRTVKALRVLLEGREVAQDDLVFISNDGGSWHGRNCLSKEFCKLKTKAGITTPGAGFQWLRHSFITEASQGGDLLAVQLACGHADRSITQNYIHSINDPRLVKIADLVESWLIGDPEARKG